MHGSPLLTCQPGSLYVVEAQPNTRSRFFLARRGRDSTPVQALPVPGVLRQQRKILRGTSTPYWPHGVVRHAFECPAVASSGPLATMLLCAAGFRWPVNCRRLAPPARHGPLSPPAALRRRLATGQLAAAFPHRAPHSLRLPLLCTAGFPGPLRPPAALLRPTDVHPLLAAGFFSAASCSTRTGTHLTGDARVGRATLFRAVLFLSLLRVVYFIDVRRCACTAELSALSGRTLGTRVCRSLISRLLSPRSRCSAMCRRVGLRRAEPVGQRGASVAVCRHVTGAVGIGHMYLW